MARVAYECPKLFKGVRLRLEPGARRRMQHMLAKPAGVRVAWSPGGRGPPDPDLHQPHPCATRPKVGKEWPLELQEC